MEDGPSHQSCGTDNEQSSERLIEIHLVKMLPRRLLALISVRRQDGAAVHSKFMGRRFSSLSQREPFRGVDGPMNSAEEVDRAV